MVEAAFEIFKNMLGEQVMGIWWLLFGIYMINSLLTRMFGMKKLDMLFDGKEYNDYWSRSLELRYLRYCVQYMCCEVTIEDARMKWWMRISVFVEMVMYLSIAVIACIWGYLAIVT